MHFTTDGTSLYVDVWTTVEFIADVGIEIVIEGGSGGFPSGVVNLESCEVSKWEEGKVSSAVNFEVVRPVLEAVVDEGRSHKAFMEVSSCS
jgi:hypothetical protein